MGNFYQKDLIYRVLSEMVGVGSIKKEVDLASLSLWLILLLRIVLGWSSENMKKQKPQWEFRLGTLNRSTFISIEEKKRITMAVVRLKLFPSIRESQQLVKMIWTGH